MNKVFLMGRLTKDPDVRYSQGEKPTTVARYSLAVQRRYKTDGQECDFINCVAFGKGGEFAEKYLKKGMKIAVVGRLNTGSYTNKEGAKIYTTDVIVDEHEFCESKNAQSGNSQLTQQQPNPMTNPDGFMQIPPGVEEELPFQ